MNLKKHLMILSLSVMASFVIVSPASAKIRPYCPYEDCTATGTHKHGRIKYSTSCTYATCTKSNCTKTGVHKHHHITYASCPHDSYSSSGHHGGHHRGHH